MGAYSVYNNSKTVAENMKLEDALILLKALFESKKEEKWVELTIIKDEVEQ